MARDTRQAMVLTAVELLRERGADGVTLDTLLSRSGAPRGSIYHHFPGGRAQILDEAVQLGGDAIAALIAGAAASGPTAVLDRLMAFWQKMLQDSNFTAGCPVVSVAVSAQPGSTLVEHANRIFVTWRTLLSECFAAAGLETEAAQRLATMSIAAMQGAITMCRAQSSMQPLEDVAAELRVLVAARTLFCESTVSSAHPGTN